MKINNHPFLVFIFSLMLIPVILPAQNYCTPSTTGGAGNSFYTHFLEVSFGDINHTLPAPTASPANIYIDRSSTDSTVLVRGEAYSFSIKLGNGANTQTVAGWIDFNQNGLFETTEKIFQVTDRANQGDHRHTFLVKIPGNKALGKTRFRIGSVYGASPPNACMNPIYQHFIDYSVIIDKPQIQRYLYTQTSHPVTTPILKGSSKQKILKINVRTNPDGTISPLKLDSFIFETGKTTDISNISGADLYYTANRKDFTFPLHLGKFPGTPQKFFTFPANQELQAGNNYFWLTYDISLKSKSDNILDAGCAGIFTFTRHIPDTINPAGYRKIGYCPTMGTMNWFIFIDSVGLPGKGNLTGQNPTGYTYYNTITDSLEKGKWHKLKIKTGNGVNDLYLHAWLDFNNDNLFNGIDKILFDSLTNLQNNPSNGPIEDSFFIPLSAQSGITRLRIATNYRPNAISGSKQIQPCDEEITIGEVEDYNIFLFKPGHPIAKFEYSSTCSGDTTRFNNLTTVPGKDSLSSSLWYFGDGNSGTQTNPSHYYKNPGEYKVMLITTSSLNIKDTFTQRIIIEKPVAKFDVLNAVADTPAVFIDRSQAPDISTRTWITGNDTFTGNYARYKFSAEGNYNVRLIITTAEGCRDSISKTITIAKNYKPVAYFSLPDDTLLRGLKYTISNLSFHSTGFKWKITPSYFRYLDNTNSSSVSPSLVFDSLVTYTITLTAYNSIDSSDFTLKLPVRPLFRPGAGFTANPVKVSVGEPVLFEDRSINHPTSWKWTFGDGTGSSEQFPLHKFGQKGKYDITLRVSNPEGKDSMTRRDYIIVTSDYTCGKGVNHSELFLGRINDSGGRNGNYLNTNLCNFTIKPPCPGVITLIFDTFTFNSGDYLLIYDGEDNSGIPLHTGSGFTGNSTPDTLRAYSGALYIEESTNFFNPARGFSARWESAPNLIPSPALEYDTPIYVKAPVRLKAKSLSGIRVNYDWDLYADNSIDIFNTDDTTISFQDTGKIPIILYGENCSGKDSIKTFIHVKAPPGAPLADFDVSPGREKIFNPVFFTDKSTNGPYSWYWEISPDTIIDPAFGITPTYIFDKGTDANSRNPVVTFIYPGTYSVCMTVKNDSGSVRKCKNEIIKILDEALICAQDSSSATEGSLFDDGGENGIFSSGQNCSFLINPCAIRSYLVISELDLRSNDYLRIYDGKIPLFDTVRFPKGYNGSKSNPFIPDTLISLTGSFYIEFESNSQQNFSFSGYRLDWKALPLPKDTTLIRVCEGQNVIFDDFRFYKNSAGDQFNWNLGNGIKFNTPVAYRVFNDTGLKKVVLDSRIKGKCGNRFIRFVDVNPIPEAKMILDFTCNSPLLTLKDNTQYFRRKSGLPRWFVSGEVNKTGNQVAYSIPVARKLNIKMISTNETGCKDTATKVHYFNPVVKAGFKYLDNCFGDSALFFNNSVTGFDTVISQKWYIPGMKEFGGDSFYHYFTSPGQYQVAHKIETARNCSDSISKLVTIYEKPSVKITGPVDSSCLNLPVVFVSSAQSNNYLNLWKSGNKSGKGISFSFAPGDTGINLIRLITEDTTGCKDTALKSLFVHPLPGSSFTHEIENVLSVRFHATNDADSYFWDFGNGKTGTTRDTFLTYAAPGTYNVVLRSVSSNGCTDTFTKKIFLTKVSLPGENPMAGIEVYPNPTGGSIRINSTVRANYIIMDALGKELSRGTLPRDNEFSFLIPGIYFIHFKAEGNVSVKKVVVN